MKTVPWLLGSIPNIAGLATAIYCRCHGFSEDASVAVAWTVNGLLLLLSLIVACLIHERTSSL